MVFFGKARWNEPITGHGHDADADEAVGDGVHAVAAADDSHHGDVTPHESPWIMLTPLVVLAGLSFVGGGINLPFSHATKRLEAWLEPVVVGGEHPLSKSAQDIKWVLAGVAVVAALIGIAAGIAVYHRHKAKAIEPAILAAGWKYDSSVSAFMGGPGRKLFDGLAWTDKTIVDGAVNGVATSVRGVGGLVRRTQTGFIRNYALGISLGVVGLLAWFLLKGMGVL